MKRKAFLFSASQYLNSKSVTIPNLNGVEYDITALEERFIQIGFDVTAKRNANKEEYITTLQEDIKVSPPDSIYVVYFSGHGGHYNGENYIFPSDFGSLLDDCKNIDGAGINIKEIISTFKNKGRLILILDSCRTDISISKGYYSEMTYAENVYIAYGTMFQNSSVATSELSWFTEAICDEILSPNIDVDTLFTQVRQNIFAKHYTQIPPSVNALLNKVILHTKREYDIADKEIYNFIQKHSDKYDKKFGYFKGDDLIFIDAAQYFDIGLLDAIWKFKKVNNKISLDRGIKMPELSESEEKLVSFLGFKRGKKFFYCDEISHTWYYNGRQIRMGEIPPLPPSMQKSLPEPGKELNVEISVIKKDDSINLITNLPDNFELLVKTNTEKAFKTYVVENNKICINDESNISGIKISSVSFIIDAKVKNIVGEKCCNLVGEFVKYHPVHGNKIDYYFNLR